MKQNNKLPIWMTKENTYTKSKYMHNFLQNNISKISIFFADLNEVEDTHKKISIIEFFTFLLEIVLMSLSESYLFIWIMVIINLITIYRFNVKWIKQVFNRTLIAGVMILLVILPSYFFNNEVVNIFFIFKTISMTWIVITKLIKINFNNFIELLGELHFSNVLIFIISTMILYLNMLSSVLSDRLNAIVLRSVGSLRKPYRVVGGVFGTLYLYSIKLSQDVHAAMIARCFTGKFVSRNKQKSNWKNYLNGSVKSVSLLCLFFLLKK